MNQEEKDSQDLGSGNNTRVTPALVQLSPGGENAKELPDKTDFMGESKVYAVNSRRPKTMRQVKDTHVVRPDRPNRIRLWDPVPETKWLTLYG